MFSPCIWNFIIWELFHRCYFLGVAVNGKKKFPPNHFHPRTNFFSLASGIGTFGWWKYIFDRCGRDMLYIQFLHLNKPISAHDFNLRLSFVPHQLWASHSRHITAIFYIFDFTNIFIFFSSLFQLRNLPMKTWNPFL